MGDVIQVLGGLAVFLFGMDLMTDGLKALAGDRLRRLLAMLTTNRFSGLASGAAVTAVIQSSSITTVLVVGFITAGLMSVQQSVGVILGADIGTTITAQIIAFDIVELAYVLVAIGFVCRFCKRRARLRDLGHLLLGLGLIFIGMSTMKNGTADLRHSATFQLWMASMDNRILAIGAAALFTAIVQSSSATTGVIIALATEGAIELQTGVFLLFGANVGTCITAGLAAIGKPAAAVRAAFLHVLLKVLGVAIWLPFAPLLAHLAAWLADDPARQIAHAHTLFNVSLAMVFIGFTGPLAALATRLIRQRPRPKTMPIRPVFIDRLYLDTPWLALAKTRDEITRLGDLVLDMQRTADAALLSGEADQIAAIVDHDERIDALHRLIVDHLRELSREDLTAADANELARLLELANDLENIGDIIEKIQLPLARKRFTQDLTITPETRERIGAVLEEVEVDLARAVRCLNSRDLRAAESLLDSKSRFKDLAAQAQDRIIKRMACDGPDRLPVYRLEHDIVESAKQCHYYIRRLARGIGAESRRKRGLPTGAEEGA